MRLPESAHTSRPWRVHEVMNGLDGFRLEDVWALPTRGGPDDFPRLLRVVAAFDPDNNPSGLVRALFQVRTWLGERLGWDKPEQGVGTRVRTVRDQLPADLRAASSTPPVESPLFSTVYLLDDEWAVEAANSTVHGVLHFGWVEDDNGGWRGQMAIYVKPNGVLGQAYMAAIKPFRYLVVYPQLMRQFERGWKTLGAGL